MEKRYEDFYKNLQKLITDFKKKKNEYYYKYIVIKIAMIVCSAISTLFISLMFISNLENVFRILSVVFSSISTIVIAIDKVFDYRSKWRQRTLTLVKLQKVKRLFKLYVKNEDNSGKREIEFNKLVELEEIVLEDDWKLWEDNTNTNDESKE